MASVAFVPSTSVICPNPLRACAPSRKEPAVACFTRLAKPCCGVPAHFSRPKLACQPVVASRLGCLAIASNSLRAFCMFSSRLGASTWAVPAAFPTSFPRAPSLAPSATFRGSRLMTVPFWSTVKSSVAVLTVLALLPYLSPSGRATFVLPWLLTIYGTGLPWSS
jgi:hypothetical protein